MAVPVLRFLRARRGESLWRLGALFARSLLAEGPRPTWRRLRSYVRTVTDAAEAPRPTADRRGDVLFVAGCPGHPRRWRCEHARERLEAAGRAADVVDHPAVDLLPFVARYESFVLQRVPHDATVERFVRAARAAGKRVVVDVDDLVIHERYGPELPILAGYGEFARELYVQQLRRIGQVLALAEAATAPTEELAAELRACFPHLDVEVVPNAPSEAMRARSAAALAAHPDAEDDGDATAPVTFGYFAGTRTHDADLATITAPLAELLRERPHARLLLVGEVEAPAALRPFGDRVERRPPVPWEELPALLRRADAHLVPLVESRFTACKSELKWTEAALVARPVLAAAVGPYRRCVRDGENGWLCRTDADWTRALRAACDAPALRRAFGRAARADLGDE
ncbi:MAG: glycosyltransferase [Planctomycetota bacterium]